MMNTVTDVGNRELVREWICVGYQVSHGCQGTVSSKGPSRDCLPVASVTFPATSSFSFSKAARVLSVSERSGFESVQEKVMGTRDEFVCVSRFNTVQTHIS